MPALEDFLDFPGAEGVSIRKDAANISAAVSAIYASTATGVVEEASDS
jgi:hypothetical protein